MENIVLGLNSVKMCTDLVHIVDILSSLIPHSNNETIISWWQRYNQVNDNFLKSDHPAVARTKPRLSSPFPIANPAFGSPSSGTLSFPQDPYNQSPNPGEFRQEADAQEVIPSYNEYIIPIPDPKPEEVFTDVPSERPARYREAEKDAADVCQMLGLQERWGCIWLTRAVFFPPHTHSSRCWAETIAALWRLTWRHVFIAYINSSQAKVALKTK